MEDEKRTQENNEENRGAGVPLDRRTAGGPCLRSEGVPTGPGPGVPEDRFNEESPREAGGLGEGHAQEEGHRLCRSRKPRKCIHLN